jgi:hypothetical protein
LRALAAFAAKDQDEFNLFEGTKRNGIKGFPVEAMKNVQIR